MNDRPILEIELREKLNVTDTYCLMTPDGERGIE